MRLIWVIHPFSQTVAVYKLATGLIPQIIGPEGELDGAEVIPGFKLAVKALFPEILNRKIWQTAE